MAWIHLDSGRVGDTPLDLYVNGSDYMIRVDGLELMNSRWHRSEVALAEAASPYLRPGGRVLIGGLGLGFTLAAFEEKFAKAKVVVAEKSPDVIRWYRQYFQKRFLKTTSAAILEVDVRHLVHENFDVIVLDVDNGPKPLSCPENADLYSVTGLREMKQTNPRAILFWSAFQSSEFMKTAAAAGFACEEKPVRVGHQDHEHFIYICSPRN